MQVEPFIIVARDSRQRLPRIGRRLSGRRRFGLDSIVYIIWYIRVSYIVFNLSIRLVFRDTLLLQFFYYNIAHLL